MNQAFHNARFAARGFVCRLTKVLRRRCRAGAWLEVGWVAAILGKECMEVESRIHRYRARRAGIDCPVQWCSAVMSVQDGIVLERLPGDVGFLLRPSGRSAEVEPCTVPSAAPGQRNKTSLLLSFHQQNYCMIGIRHVTNIPYRS